jgi:hypothetical protein
MSDEELEHLARSPARFEAKISRSARAGEQPMQPYQRRIITTWLDNTRVPTIDTAHLLPGGRYLVTCSSRTGIYVWDLGYNGDVAPKAKPAMFIRVPEDFVFGAAWPNTSGFRLIYYMWVTSLHSTPNDRVY